MAGFDPKIHKHKLHKFMNVENEEMELILILINIMEQLQDELGQKQNKRIHLLGPKERDVLSTIRCHIQSEFERRNKRK